VRRTCWYEHAGGIIDDDTASTSSDHIISIVGFGKDPDTGKDVTRDARALRRGGKINDEVELELEDYMADKYSRHLEM
jgi:hypothetical protein